MKELYLVTGASGHLGNVLVKKLLECGSDVRVLLLPGEKIENENEVEIVRGDVRDRKSLIPFFENPDQRQLIVVHCAGIVSIASRYNPAVHDVNVRGTMNITDLCVENHVKKLVYISSVHAIPEKPKGQVIIETRNFGPGSVVGLYAKTKAEATAYVLEATKGGLDASVIHPSGICGPNDSGRGHLTALVSDYCHQKLPAAMDGGYDFVDVRDVADGILACCRKGRSGECYILSNRYYSIREIMGYLHKITGKKEIKNYLPLWLVKLAAPLAEMYYRIRKAPPLFTPYSIYTLNSNAIFSHQKATLELGYAPRGIYESLRDAVEWLREKKRI